MTGVQTCALPISAEKPDMAAIDKNIEKIASIRVQIAKIMVKHHMEMRAQLTDEQRLKFDLMKGKMGKNKELKGRLGSLNGMKGRLSMHQGMKNNSKGYTTPIMPGMN